VLIRTRLKNMRESLLHFGYEILRAADGTLLAEGETTHIVVDSKFQKTPLPEKYLRAFQSATGR
jgi:acyl-CoA thioester hydrolase